MHEFFLPLLPQPLETTMQSHVELLDWKNRNLIIVFTSPLIPVVWDNYEFLKFQILT